MGGVVLSPKTFEWSDVAVEVLMCLVCPHCGSLLQLYLMHWFQLLLGVLQWEHA